MRFEVVRVGLSACGLLSARYGSDAGNAHLGGVGVIIETWWDACKSDILGGGIAGYVVFSCCIVGD